MGRRATLPARPVARPPPIATLRGVSSTGVPDRPWKTRTAVRVIVITDDDHVLLFADTDPGVPGVHWWVTPGGGVDPGETERQTGVRELFEETGLRVAEDALVGPLARRRVQHGYSDQVLDQTETFYLVRTPRFEVDIAGHTPEEQLTLQGHRWWPRAELADAGEWVWPGELAELINRAETGQRQPPLDLGIVRSESTVPIAD